HTPPLEPPSFVPSSPRGMTKLNTAALSVPTFVTIACEPGAPVVPLPTVLVSATPAGPLGPSGPWMPSSPFSPFSPRGPSGPGGPSGRSGPAGPGGPWIGPVFNQPSLVQTNKSPSTM